MGKLIFVMVVALLALAMAMAEDQPFRSPFKSPFPRADHIAIASIASSSEPKCPLAPPPVRDIISVSKFGENRRAHASTVIDPEAASEYAESIRSLSDFSRNVSSVADRLVDKHGTGGRDARCVMLWLSVWAEHDALLGRVNNTGEAVRKWELASLATSYLKIRSAPHDPEQSAIVRGWLKRVARHVEADYSRNLTLDSRSNNHLNWAAWAVMAAAIASDDSELFDWSVNRFRYALAQIGEDGTLPLELKRRQLALAYHNYALAPLIMLREGAAANGIALSPDEHRRLRTLIDLVLTGIDNPSAIEARTGFPQDMKEISAAHLAWLEPYYARSRDPRVKQVVEANRPLSFTRLGGNLTALFGDAVSPPPSQAAGSPPSIGTVRERPLKP